MKQGSELSASSVILPVTASGEGLVWMLVGTLVLYTGQGPRKLSLMSINRKVEKERTDVWSEVRSLGGTL